MPELSTYSGGKRVVPDGTVRDEFRLARGWWEAKDTSDQLAAEIQKKLKAGYPTRNTIFEDTQVAVLYQDRGEAGEFALREPVTGRGAAEPLLLPRRIRRARVRARHGRVQEPHSGPGAVAARAYRRRAQEEPGSSRKPSTAFVTLCRASLNPELTEQPRG